MTDYVQRAVMALGTVFANRFFDSRQTRLMPAFTAPFYFPEIPTIQVALGLSSSIAFLYYQLREGNMVNVSTIVSNTRTPVSHLRRSWLIRYLNSYRRRCASAVRRILLTPRDSLQLLRSGLRNCSVNTFDSASELRHRESQNRRTIKRRGRSRRRRRPILGVTRVRQEIGGGDTRCRISEERPARTRSQATEVAEIKRKILKNKSQQVATNCGAIARKTRSGKIYGCS